VIAARTWATRSQLELFILEYVAWFNSERLHEASTTGHHEKSRNSTLRKARQPHPSNEGREPTNPDSAEPSPAHFDQWVSDAQATLYGAQNGDFCPQFCPSSDFGPARDSSLLSEIGLDREETTDGHGWFRTTDPACEAEPERYEKVSKVALASQVPELPGEFCPSDGLGGQNSRTLFGARRWELGLSASERFGLDIPETPRAYVGVGGGALV
jgi:hypothetical protein